MRSESRNAIHRVGSLRLAALALLAPGAVALGQAAGGAQPSRVMVSARADSAQKANIVVLRHTSPRIDSLVQRLNGLALGSEAYRLTEDTLRAALREVPRSPVAAGSREYTIVGAQAPRAALRFPALD